MIFFGIHEKFLLYCLLCNLQLLFGNMKTSGARKHHRQGEKSIGPRKNTTTRIHAVPATAHADKQKQSGNFTTNVKLNPNPRKHKYSSHQTHFAPLLKNQLKLFQDRYILGEHDKILKKTQTKKHYRVSPNKTVSGSKKDSLIVPLFSQDELVLLESVKQILKFIGKSRPEFQLSPLGADDRDFKDLSLMASKKENIVNSTTEKKSISFKNRTMIKKRVTSAVKRLKTSPPSKKFAIDLGATYTIHNPQQELLGDHELLQSKEQGDDAKNAIDKDLDRELQSHLPDPITSLKQDHPFKSFGPEDVNLSDLKPSTDNYAGGILEDMTTPISDQTSNKALGSDVSTVAVDPLPGGPTVQNRMVDPSTTASAVKLTDIKRLVPTQPFGAIDSILTDRTLSSRSYTGGQSAANKKQIGPRKSQCQQALVDKMGSKLYQKLLEGDKASPQWVQSMSGDVTDTAKEKTKHDHNLQDVQESQQRQAADEANENSARIFEKSENTLEKDPGGFLGYQYSKLKSMLTQKNISNIPKETNTPANTSETEEVKVDCTESLLEGLRQKAKLKAQQSSESQPNASAMDNSGSNPNQPVPNDGNSESERTGSPESKDDKDKGSPYFSKLQNSLGSDNGMQQESVPSPGQSSEPKQEQSIKDAADALAADRPLQASEENAPGGGNILENQPQQAGLQFPNKDIANPNIAKVPNQWQSHVRPPAQYQLERHVRPRARKLFPGPSLYSKQTNNPLLQKQAVIYKGANQGENAGLEIVPVDPYVPDTNNIDLLQKSRKRLSEASYRLGDKVLRRIQKSIFFTNDEQSPEDQVVRDALNATLSSEERKEFIKEFLLLKALEELYAKTDWEKLNKEADEEASKIEKLAETKEKPDSPVESRSSTQATSPRVSNATAAKINSTFIGCKNGTVNVDGKVGSCKVREGSVYVSKNSTFSFEDERVGKMKNISSMFRNGTGGPDSGQENEENTNGFSSQEVRPWGARLITNNPIAKTLPSKSGRNASTDHKKVPGQLDKGKNETSENKTMSKIESNNEKNDTLHEDSQENANSTNPEIPQGDNNTSGVDEQSLPQENVTNTENISSSSNVSDSDSKNQSATVSSNEVIDDPPNNQTEEAVHINKHEIHEVGDDNGNQTKDSAIHHHHAMGEREAKSLSGLHRHFMRFRRRGRTRYHTDPRHLHISPPHDEHQDNEAHLTATERGPNQPAEGPPESKHSPATDAKVDEHDLNRAEPNDQVPNREGRTSAEQPENPEQGSNEGGEQVVKSSRAQEGDGGENEHKTIVSAEEDRGATEKSQLKEPEDEHSNENGMHEDPGPNVDTQPEPENLLEDEKKLNHKTEKPFINEVGQGVLKVSKDLKPDSSIAEEAKNIVEKLTHYSPPEATSDHASNNADQEIIVTKQVDQGQDVAEDVRLNSEEQVPDSEHGRQESDPQAGHSEQNGQGGEEEPRVSDDVGPDPERDRADPDHSQLSSQDHQAADKISHEDDSYSQSYGQGQDKDGNDQGSEDASDGQSQGQEEPSREEDISENGEYNSSHAEQNTNEDPSKVEEQAPGSDQYDPYTTFKKSLVQKGVTYVKKKQELFLALIKKIRNNLLQMVTSKIINKKSIVVRKSRRKRNEKGEKYLNDLRTFLSANLITSVDLKTGTSKKHKL